MTYKITNQGNWVYTMRAKSPEKVRKRLAKFGYKPTDYKIKPL